MRQPELRSVFGESFAIIRRFPVATLVPAAGLGALADVLQLTGGGPLVEIAIGLGLAVVFELYVAYAERLLLEWDRQADRISVVRLVAAGAPLLPRLLLASLPAVALPFAATGLLIAPGLWLVTRWVLYAPVIAREEIGAQAALSRSSGLVRGHFWRVFAVATAAVVVEHAVIHGTANTATTALGSQLLGLLCATVAVAVVSPFAALTISLVYERLLAVAR